MTNKNNIVSYVLFIISLALFVIFAISIFFGGQILGGAIYFIYFAIMLAFAILDRKYASNFYAFYRYSTYLCDAFNILALASMIYYNIHIGFMIASISLFGITLFIDLLSKNRYEKRRLEGIIVMVLNCLNMFAIFPYFFEESLSVILAILVLIISAVITILKLILAVVPFKKEVNSQEKSASESSELENKISSSKDDEDIQ